MADGDSPAYTQQLADHFARLATADAGEAFPELRRALRDRDPGTYDKHIVPRLACRALLRHGPAGVMEVYAALPEAPGAIYPNAIIEALWYASRGELGSDFLGVAALSPPLTQTPDSETSQAAARVVRDLIAESRVNDGLFWQLLDFTSRMAMNPRLEGEAEFLTDVRRLFAEATIKLTPSLLEEFHSLIVQDLPEETYQQFLAAHPVLLDPLAAEVVPKQRMGLEHVTDFAVRRLDDRWTLVEIEKPQDPVFTAAANFSKEFTHAFGQVIDFQRWVEENGAYAEKLMPGIASPRGLLLIGRRSAIDDGVASKLRRFVANSASIEVLTFDDVLAAAEALYANLYYRPLQA